MKIKFIMPYSGEPQKSLLTNYDFITRVFFRSKRRDESNRMSFYSLAFPILAALTPPEYELELLDEAVDVLDLDEPVDIVALTGMTYMAPYAYRLADEYRKRGVTVVMGGVHVSLAIEEALAQVDTVFVGEGENIWRQFLDDFKAGKPQRVYRDSGVVDFREFVLPRWDLVKTQYYFPYFIQASRGCCFDCNFCQIHLVFGNQIRYKPVEHVIAEIRQLKKLCWLSTIGDAPLALSDDNIIANVPYARQLFEALIPLKIKWWGLASANVARNEELLALMVRSGCDNLFIGFESLSQESLDLANKGMVNKVERFRQDLEVLHRYRINVSSLMMYGMDGDGPDIFRKTVDFVRETDLEFPIFHTILPLPGTAHTRALEAENRILCRDWTKYTGNFACIVPRKMTPAQLEQGTDWSTKVVYSEEAILQKIENVYQQGALRGDKPQWVLRIGVTIYLLVEMFKVEKPVARFIGKIIRLLWTRKNIKVTTLLTFIDHFEYARRIPATEPVT
jgi:radical SAM superfamily enzyme YgiQ (UPF0313 family)